MKRIVFLIAIALTVASCQKDLLNVNDSSNVVSKSMVYDDMGNAYCEADSFTIYGGQSIEVGSLVVSNDDVNVTVKYEITNPSYFISEVHLWIGDDLTLVPFSGNGAPVPGLFPYKAEGLNVMEYEFVIPIADVFTLTNSFCEKQLYIYAHAAVEPVPGSGVQEGETAWSFGTPFSGPRWGWYSTYTICCAKTPPPAEFRSETAFGKFTKANGGFVFTTGKNSNPEKYPSLNLTQNRWGWAGNLAQGSYVADLFAGAGLNNVSNATLVGKLYVTVTGTTVTVNYVLSGGNTMSEVHIYVGDSAPKTIAPGQYGHTAYFDPKATSYSYSFDVSDLNGDGKFWVIAHAVANIPVY